MAGAMAAHARCAMVRDLHRVTSEEQLFASAYNASPPTAQGAGVKWALRGYLPPKHLRIPGIDYGVPEDSAMTMFGGDISPSVVGRESISYLLAGCFAAAQQSGVDADAVMDEDGVSEVTGARREFHSRFSPSSRDATGGRSRAFRGARARRRTAPRAARTRGAHLVDTVAADDALRFSPPLRFADSPAVSLPSSSVAVTEQNPHERVVKGGMASRPSWGQNNYAAQREKLAAAYRKSPDGSPKG